jgi:predicted ester cyclase
MGTLQEAVVPRFYEAMNNGQKRELAEELFTPDHVLPDPQAPAAQGPQGMLEAVRPYQEAVNSHWAIEDIRWIDHKVTVRWVGIGTHTGELNDIEPTGKAVRVNAIVIHRTDGAKIAETWEGQG